MSTNEERAEAMYGAMPAKEESTTPVKGSDRADAFYATPAKSTTPVNSPADELYPDDRKTNPDGQSTELGDKPDSESLYYETDEALPDGNPYSLREGTVEDLMYGGQSTVQLSEDTDLSVIYSNPDDQAALAKNLGYIASEIGATQGDLAVFVNTANELLITGEIPEQQQAMAALYADHGGELPHLIENAQLLIQSIPDLAEWLDSTGLGNSPKMINHVIRMTKTPRGEERLKQLRNK